MQTDQVGQFTVVRREPDRCGDKMLLEGKSALVTGAARGIGAATAIALAQEGARVLINYRSREDAARRVLESIQSSGGTADLFQADVADRTRVAEMMACARERFGSLDILVNNAGESSPLAILDITPGEWDRIIAVNLTGVFNCLQAAIPIMLEAGGGTIVNVATMGVRFGSVGGAHYAAAKGGVVAFTRSAARELAPKNIRINAVSPPLTETDLGLSVFPRVDRAAYESTIPLGRLARADEVAGVIVFLASPRSSYITGETIWVSGGR